MDKGYWFLLCIFVVTLIIVSMYKLVRFETITHSNNTYSITHYRLSKHITVSLESLKNPGEPGEPGACAVLVQSREGFTKLIVECE